MEGVDWLVIDVVQVLKTKRESIMSNKRFFAVLLFNLGCVGLSLYSQGFFDEKPNRMEFLLILVVAQLGWIGAMFANWSYGDMEERGIE